MRLTRIPALAATLCATLCTLVLSTPATAQSRSAVEAERGQVGKALSQGSFQGRPYGFYAPAGATSGAAQPLLLVLHGTGGGYLGVATRTRFHEEAARHGFIVVYPDATPRDVRGKQRKQWDPYGRNVDDAGYIAALIADLKRRFRIAPDRVFATGMSNGAGMAQSLGCQVDAISGVAPVAASLSPRAYSAICPSLSQPVPFLGFFGTVDRNGELAKFEKSVDLYARLNGCATDYSRQALPDRDPRDNTTVELRIAAGARGGACSVPIHYYRIAGGGHFWPGATYRPQALEKQGAASTKDIDATKIIVSFFGLDRR